MHLPFTPDLLALIRGTRSQGHRPLLFSNAHVITADPLIGDFESGDVLLGRSRVVGIGPGLLSAAEDDNAIVIDCTGFVIVPGVIDTAQLTGLRPASFRPAGAIAPGHSANFAVLPAVAGEAATDTLRRFLSTPESAPTVVADGEVLLWDGSPIDPEPGQGEETVSPTAPPAERLGTWIDENGFVHQHLTADGRYDETRGGREHAYQGNFWINGDRIDYRDDLGFWAFGEFTGNTLQHAGYTFHRA
ncbi:Atu4866 domain-containing protein [Arthrobacter sp. G119Y2]|uniref:Atu4866 domain-containing protein n=1 Tax=Arthrobacter sp. G119Y2 TaxID=3134965 RepID=UPI0031194366